jgi:hypothetical protein
MIKVMFPEHSALDPLYEPSIEVLVSLWPQTWLWWLVTAVLMAGFLRLIWTRGLRWWQDRYRREALVRLLAFESLPPEDRLLRCHELLKIVATHCYGRLQVASIDEAQWYLFLNSTAPKPVFSHSLMADIDAALYQDRPLAEAQLSTYCGQCRAWILEHQVGER